MDIICKNCGGAFRCTNLESPCFGYFCGEYPGTGYVTENKTEEQEEDNYGNTN